MTNEKNTSLDAAPFKVSMDLLKKLRGLTQLGYADCQKALLQAKNDEAKALFILKSNSLIAASKRLNRKVNEGTIASYIHKSPKTSAKEGVLIHLACETSFVANLAEFVSLAQILAKAIYQYKPKYLYFEDIPHDKWLEKFDFYLNEIKTKNTHLPLEEQENLAIEEVRKVFGDEVLMNQNLDNLGASIEDYIGSQIGIFKENIKIVRFTRFQI